MNTNLRMNISTAAVAAISPAALVAQSAVIQNEAFMAKFEAETGMPYSAAIELAVEARRDDRLARGNSKRRSRSTSSSDQLSPAAFERLTGMSYADAFELAIEARAEDRGIYLN